MSANSSLVQSGVPGLDVLLGGGVARGSLVFVVGASGAGKTILGTQILCHAADAGTQVLILTAFSESHVKLLEHLQPLAFFNPDLVGSSITMLSMQSLVGEDPDSAATGIIRAIRESGARMVLIDGFQGLAALLPNREAIRFMVASLAGQLPYLDVTLLVTLEGSARDPAMLLELTTADVVISLDYGVVGWRHSRRIEIVKQRGRGLLAGLHSYGISAGGLHVLPRIEALAQVEPYRSGAARRSDGDTLAERASFGLAELDNLLHGGLTSRTSSTLIGAPGVGKTTLALHWAIAGAQLPEEWRERCVFVTFHEPEERLREKASHFKLDFAAVSEAGDVRLIRVPPFEVEPDRVGLMILEALSETGARRLVIDDVKPLMLELGDRAHAYLGALTEILERLGVTSLFLHETSTLLDFNVDLAIVPIPSLAENVIMVQHQQIDASLHRILAVIKMRFSTHDRTLRELVLDEQGVRVLTPRETAPGLLSEAASAAGGFAPADDQPTE